MIQKKKKKKKKTLIYQELYSKHLLIDQVLKIKKEVRNLKI